MGCKFNFNGLGLQFQAKEQDNTYVVNSLVVEKILNKIQSNLTPTQLIQKHNKYNVSKFVEIGNTEKEQLVGDYDIFKESFKGEVYKVLKETPMFSVDRKKNIDDVSYISIPKESISNQNGKDISTVNNSVFILYKEDDILSNKLDFLIFMYSKNNLNNNKFTDYIDDIIEKDQDKEKLKQKYLDLVFKKEKKLQEKINDFKFKTRNIQNFNYYYNNNSLKTTKENMATKDVMVYDDNNKYIFAFNYENKNYYYKINVEDDIETVSNDVYPLEYNDKYILYERLIPFNFDFNQDFSLKIQKMSNNTTYRYNDKFDSSSLNKNDLLLINNMNFFIIDKINFIKDNEIDSVFWIYDESSNTISIISKEDLDNNIYNYRESIMYKKTTLKRLMEPSFKIESKSKNVIEQYSKNVQVGDYVYVKDNKFKILDKTKGNQFICTGKENGIEVTKIVYLNEITRIDFYNFDLTVPKLKLANTYSTSNINQIQYENVQDNILNKVSMYKQDLSNSYDFSDYMIKYEKKDGDSIKDFINIGNLITLYDGNDDQRISTIEVLDIQDDIVTVSYFNEEEKNIFIKDLTIEDIRSMLLTIYTQNENEVNDAIYLKNQNKKNTKFKIKATNYKKDISLEENIEDEIEILFGKGFIKEMNNEDEDKDKLAKVTKDGIFLNKEKSDSFSLEHELLHIKLGIIRMLDLDFYKELVKLNDGETYVDAEENYIESIKNLKSSSPRIYDAIKQTINNKFAYEVSKKSTKKVGQYINILNGDLSGIFSSMNELMTNEEMNKIKCE